MPGSDMPRSAGSNRPGRRDLVAGQRVRVIGGPLCNLRGIIESSADSDRVLVDAGQDFPGLSIRIPASLLEIVES